MDALRTFIEGIDTIWQWLGVMLISAIPAVESYGGSMIGILAGVPYLLAVPAAIVGNIASMLAVVMFADKIRAFRNRKKGITGEEVGLDKRQQRAKALFDKWGVPGVSLIGQTVLPSQITSGIMVGFGAKRQSVIFWQVISIILWGIAFGSLAQWFSGALFM